MIPVLFDKSASTFTTWGLGALKDAISCIITEERNGAFELEMDYPMNGQHFGEIEEGAIVYAKPSENQNPQAFRIYRISEPLDGIVTIYAEHISYALKYIPVLPFTGNNLTEALAGIGTHSATTNPFTISADFTNNTVYTLGIPKSARAILGGEKESILNIYGGEFKWDNFNVYLKASRGADNGVTLRYGKNITEFNKTIDLSDTITGVLPYWKNGTDLVVGDISRAQSSIASDMIATVDLTSQFATKPTKSEVTTAGQNYLNSRGLVGAANLSFQISFIDLSKTEEYKNIAPLERVELCDTVTIIFEKFGISQKAKVIKTVYDCLLERYNSIEIGDAHYTLSNQVADQGIAVKDTISRIEVQDNLISLKVSKGEISSEISVETGQITISGNRLVVNSTNFKLYANGDATFSGNVTGATITGGTISGATITSIGSLDRTTIDAGQIKTSYLQLGEVNDGTILQGNLISISSSGSITSINPTSISTTDVFASRQIVGGSVYSDSSLVITVATIADYLPITAATAATGANGAYLNLTVGEQTYAIPTGDWVAHYHANH